MISLEANKHIQTVNNEDMYVRRKQDCSIIRAGFGTIVYELLGIHYGDLKQHSIARVEIEQNGYSRPHFHPKATEAYLIKKGTGRLVIDGETTLLTTGTLAKIPSGKVHQIFNDHAEKLKFWCICTPAWTSEGELPPEQLSETKESEQTYTRSLEGCKEFPTDTGESIYEFVGTWNGDEKEISVALVKILQGGSSSAHYHFDTEESYIMTKGQGRLVIGNTTRIVRPGDTVKIPIGKVHQIFNDFEEELEFYVACAPAWTVNCSKYV